MLTQTRSVLGRDPRNLHGLGKSDRKGVKGGLFWENWKFRVEFVGEEMLRRGSGDGSHSSRKEKCKWIEENGHSTGECSLFLYSHVDGSSSEKVLPRTEGRRKTV